MQVDAVSFLLNESVWLSSKTFKLFKYFVIALILNLMLNALNFAFVIVWIIELKIGM